MVTLKLDEHSSRERNDVVEGFEALDVHKTGRLGVDLAYTLLLGLGYMNDYKKKKEFSPDILKEIAGRIESVENENLNPVDTDSGMKVETLLKIVATHPGLSQGDRSESFAQRCFDLVDDNQKGYISVSDVEHLGYDVENIGSERENSEIRTDEAKEMIETTNNIFGGDTGTGNDEKDGYQQRLQFSVFEKVFAPTSRED